MSAAKTVLVMDDDPEVLGAVCPLLEDRGYRVLTATDGNSGLATAEREAPDLVILDMMMPRTSGFLVLEKLKHRPTPGPRVIMITANEGAKHRAYAEMLGVDDYLCKPFPLERLLESVERLCPITPETGAGDASADR
jgi:DNA-binding response OmpR family regulator